MIAVDTSVMVAILLNEPEAESFATIILADEQPVMSAAIFVECCRVMKHKQGPKAVEHLHLLMQHLEIEVVPVNCAQAGFANEATLKYPILSFGDCFSYALAKERDIPLLFKGNDFSKTDLISAV